MMPSKPAPPPLTRSKRFATVLVMPNIDKEARSTTVLAMTNYFLGNTHRSSKDGSIPRTQRYTTRCRSHHDALAPLRALIRPVSNPAAPTAPPSDRPAAIYVHTPYCTHQCSFCNLNRRCEIPSSDYVELVLHELHSHAEDPYIRSRHYEAIYFGGGTPTVLPPDDLGQLLRELRDHFDIAANAEVTIETSVSDLSTEHIETFHDGGVSRFSVGVQTFVDRGRRLLHRHGSGQKAARKLQDLLDAGFRNVGIDLIYNWPGQTDDDLLADLEVIRSLDLAGLSFYALILMEGAPLQGMIQSGACPVVGGLAHERALFDRVMADLLADGYQLLELTKLVKPGRDQYDYVRIRYANGDTLPLGAGAGGRVGRCLRMNPADPAAYRTYVKRLPNRPGPSVQVTPPYDAAKRLVGWLETGRILWSDLQGLELTPQIKMALRALIDELVVDGLMITDSQGIYLTLEGIFYGNNVANELASVIANLSEGGGSRGASHPRAATSRRKA